MQMLQIPTYDHIDQIIALNRKYLVQLGVQNKIGFIRIAYSRDELQRIITSKEIIIAIVDYNVVAYYLIGRSSDSPALGYQKNKAMSLFDTYEIQYSKVGYGCQVCIEEKYRSNGLFSQMLLALIKCVKNKYSHLLCSVSEENLASLNTHLNNGWKVIDHFETPKYYIFKTY